MKNTSDLSWCHKDTLSIHHKEDYIVQTYGKDPMHATPDNEMIARMLHLPPDKNKLLSENDIQRVQVHMAECEIDNRMVYDVLQICKDIYLYSYVKQHKPKRDSRGAFYSIHSRWLGPNHVNVMASEAEMALQRSMYDRGKRAWNLEKYVACHVKYNSILGNLMEYGYQCLDPGSKV